MSFSGRFVRTMLSSPDEDGAGGGGGAGGTPTATGAAQPDQRGQEQDAPPAWFVDFASKVENRIGDIGRQMASLKDGKRNAPSAGEPKKNEDQQPQREPGLSRADLDAAVRLGEVRGTLPEKAREQLDAMAQEGLSYSEQLRFAKFAAATLESATPRNGQESQTPTRGAGGTPARSQTAPAHPKTMREMQVLKAKDPDAFNRLWDDPTFTPPSR